MSKEFEKQLVTAMKLALGLLEKNRLARALCFPREKRKELRKGQREEAETSPACCSFAQYFLNPFGYTPRLCFTCPPRYSTTLKHKLPEHFITEYPTDTGRKPPNLKTCTSGAAHPRFSDLGPPKPLQHLRGRSRRDNARFPTSQGCQQTSATAGNGPPPAQFPSPHGAAEP